MKNTAINLTVLLTVCAVFTAAAAEQFGALQTDVAQMQLLVQAANGKSLQLSINSAGTWNLAPGTYRTRTILLKATEKQGRQQVAWTLSSKGKLGKLARFIVRAGETVSIPAGPPLVAKAALQRVGRQVLISPVLVGRAGEQYEVGARRNGRTQSAPGLRIVDAGGNTLATGKFEYG